MQCQFCDQPARYHIVTPTGRILDVCDEECEHGTAAVRDAMHLRWSLSVICRECGWLDDHADGCDIGAESPWLQYDQRV